MLTFAAGAPLSSAGGTVGSKHFAAIEAMGSTASQQILGNPVITAYRRRERRRRWNGYFATFLGNNAAIVTDPGTSTSQTINAQSITMQGGGGRDNNAHIGAWGTGAPQTITVIGDLRITAELRLGTPGGSRAFGHQAISARSLEMIGTGEWRNGIVYTANGASRPSLPPARAQRLGHRADQPRYGGRAVRLYQ